MRRDLERRDMIKLGAMECAASCVATGLHIAGLDYRRFMLDYWQLSYYAGVLMLRGSILRTDLSFAYGIDKKLADGHAERLIGSLGSHRMAILMCRASRLRYFPSRLLGLESDWFQHHILLDGWDPDTGAVRVIDPIAEFIGELSVQELLEASIRKEQFVFYTLEFPIHYEPPTGAELFIRSSEANYRRNVKGERSFEEDAFGMFVRDLTRIVNTDRATFDNWIECNNVTISSIVKSRPLHWRSMCSLTVLDAREERAGEGMISVIAKQWAVLNFLLIKLKRNRHDAQILAAICSKVTAIQSAEREFLAFMYEKGRELSAV